MAERYIHVLLVRKRYHCTGCSTFIVIWPLVTERLSGVVLRANHPARAKGEQCLHVALTWEPKSSPRIPRSAVTRPLADNRTADAEVAMQTRFLFLAPVLVSIAGCSEKIEAQENDPQSSEIRVSPARDDEAANTSEEQETDLKLRTPVGLD